MFHHFLGDALAERGHFVISDGVDVSEPDNAVYLSVDAVKQQYVQVRIEIKPILTTMGSTRHIYRGFLLSVVTTLPGMNSFEEVVIVSEICHAQFLENFLLVQIKFSNRI